MGKYGSILGLLLVCGCVTRAAAPPEAPDGEAWVLPARAQEAQISSAPAQTTPVGETLTVTGRITFDDLHVAHVTSPVSGRITRIMAEPGQRVTAGEALAVIASPDLGQASADMDKARADLGASEHDWRRQQQLFERHAASQKDYEAAEDNYHRASAEYRRSQEKMALLQRGGSVNVGQEFVLRAAVGGRVIGRFVNPGQEIAGQYSGGASGELFTVGSLQQVWVLADIFEVDAGRVHVGQKVQMSVQAYPHETFAGTVNWVSSTLDPATRTVTVRCVIDNPQDKLKPEMLAAVHIADAGGAPTLTVPRSSVVHVGEKTVVFVQQGTRDDGRLRFVRRPVIVDENVDGDRLPVQHGLRAGEPVVVDGSHIASAAH